VAASPDTWTGDNRVAFARVQDLFVADRFHDCVIAASALLDRAKRVGQSGVYRVLGELILECAGRIAPGGETPNAEPTCSFSSRKPPEVRLGAGPSAFICDGCVGGFAGIFASLPADRATKICNATL